jgi:hypothetical protein
MSSFGTSFLEDMVRRGIWQIVFEKTGNTKAEFGTSLNCDIIQEVGQQGVYCETEKNITDSLCHGLCNISNDENGNS